MRPRLWRAWLTDEASRSIVEASGSAHPKETGGVLLGVLTGRRPWITAAVEIPSAENTGHSFVLRGSDRAREVDRARRADARIGYLGEWHSHPADAGPSGKDISSMLELASDPLSQCSRPVLLIARRTERGYEFDAHQADMRLRRLNLLAAGTPH